jgi:hypothetical protein
LHFQQHRSDDIGRQELGREKMVALLFVV